MDKEDAIKATRQGAIAACISGALTTLIFLIAIATNAGEDDGIGLWNDPWILFDIVLIFLCAFFIFKKSRVAAIVMFVYFVFSKIYIGLERESFAGIGLSLIFLFFFGKAVMGAFAFHKIEKAENPDYKPVSKKVWVTVSVVTALFFTLMGFGLMTMTGFAPSTEIQSGAELNQKHVDKLVSANIVTSREDIEYFYSTAVLSVLAEGVVLTKDELILYFDSDGDDVADVYYMTFDEIKKIELQEKGSYLVDESYLISSDDPDGWLMISLSVENDGHLKFMDALRAKTGIE